MYVLINLFHLETLLIGEDSFENFISDHPEEPIYFENVCPASNIQKLLKTFESLYLKMYLKFKVKKNLIKKTVM